MPKRKSFRERHPVLVNFERDQWDEFVKKCDTDHKSTALRLYELIGDDLQKNQLGANRPGPTDLDPIGLNKFKKGNKRSARPDRLQTDLRIWMFRDNIRSNMREFPDMEPHQYMALAKNFAIAHYLTQGIGVSDV